MNAPHIEEPTLDSIQEAALEADSDLERFKMASMICETMEEDQKPASTEEFARFAMAYVITTADKLRGTGAIQGGQGLKPADIAHMNKLVTIGLMRGFRRPTEFEIRGILVLLEGDDS